MPWISVSLSTRPSVCGAVGTAAGTAVVTGTQPQLFLSCSPFSCHPPSHKGQITFTARAAPYSDCVEPAAAVAEALVPVPAFHTQKFARCQVQHGGCETFLLVLKEEGVCLRKVMARQTL